MPLAIVALMFVCFVDVMGQGLAFPIFDELMLKPETGFLPADLTEAERQLRYGIAIGVFFATWFIGAIYISRLSDSIGRRAGILICLAGSIAGYGLAAVAIMIDNYALLVASRAVTGFTAGTQPIAAAAMVDLARDEGERTRNLGLVTVGVSLGLISGPIIGGVFSDPALLGGAASLVLPFYVGGALCLAAALMIAFTFRDVLVARAPLRLSPLEIPRLLARAIERPAVFAISIPYFFYMICFMGFYVFVATNLTSRFGLGTDATSLAMFLMGVGLALASGLLVGPINARVPMRRVTIFTALALCIVIALFLIAPTAALAFLLVLPAGALHGIGYPTFLTAFSLATDEDEQGWVMGFSTALFTLAATIVSFGGGALTAFGAAGPFLLAIACGVLAIVTALLVWRPSAPAAATEGGG